MQPTCVSIGVHSIRRSAFNAIKTPSNSCFSANHEKSAHAHFVQYQHTCVVFTASHSLRSSPGGSRTASFTLPAPRVASIWRFSWRPFAPIGGAFFGRIVFAFLQGDSLHKPLLKVAKNPTFQRPNRTQEFHTRILGFEGRPTGQDTQTHARTHAEIGTPSPP